MHTIEPYWNWRNLYTAEDDPQSPFYGREYSEFEFSERIYDHYIHPQWDNIGSTTLFLKILYVEYDEGFAILEFIGEWNDCLYNDIRTLKRDIIDGMIELGIHKFILIGENVMSFHASDDSYYEEWVEDVEDGWIALINFHEHVLKDFRDASISPYFVADGGIVLPDWRTFRPLPFFQKVEQYVNPRISLT